MVFCLIGKPGVGKTALCLHWAKHTNGIAVPIGQILRHFLGTDYFLAKETPAAPKETDEYVKKLVDGAIRLSLSTSRDVFLDGTPRKQEQIEMLPKSALIVLVSGTPRIANREALDKILAHEASAVDYDKLADEWWQQGGIFPVLRMNNYSDPDIERLRDDWHVTKVRHYVAGWDWAKPIIGA